MGRGGASRRYWDSCFFLSIGLQGFGVLVAGASAGLWPRAFQTAMRFGRYLRMGLLVSVAAGP